ncbi:MAG TPA: hypothetical protein VGM13_04190 [Thermoanaerobaculia bacterium]|jgi:hypothetical protein
MPTSVRLDEKTRRPVDTRPSRCLYDAIAPSMGAATGGPPDLSEKTGERFQAALLARENGTAPRPRRKRAR